MIATVLVVFAIGLIVGNHVKISVSPDLLTFLKASWALANEKALPVATSAAKELKATASKSVKAVAKSSLRATMPVPAISENLVKVLEDDQ